jgi:hypothetical protein
MKTAKFRSRQRSTQRGTALMEALMVNMVLLPVLGGIIFFRETYSAKIQSLQNARAYAWTYAFSSCDTVPDNAAILVHDNFGTPVAGDGIASNGDDLQSELSGTGNAVPSTGTSLDGDPNYTNNVFGTGSTSIGGQNMGTVNATSTTQMSFGSGLLRVTGAQVTSSEHVQCNPWPANESDIEDTFIQSARDLANW